MYAKFLQNDFLSDNKIFSLPAPIPNVKNLKLRLSEAFYTAEHISIKSRMIQIKQIKP